jgi:serine/threonine protein kinase
MTPGGRLAVAVCCGQQILEALKYVHAAGLIHGDVSMANILIGGLKQDDLAALSVVSENTLFTLGTTCNVNLLSGRHFRYPVEERRKIRCFSEMLGSYGVLFS